MSAAAMSSLAGFAQRLGPLKYWPNRPKTVRVAPPTNTRSRTPSKDSSTGSPEQSMPRPAKNSCTPARVSRPRHGPATFTRCPQRASTMAELPVSPPGTLCVSSISA
ncbi:MAG: hypothetical protein BWX86_02995 [Verrucomicrobia bacterium ADurb.Bin122]|nr:MAG: hypothetical protein BWX86_02995 [Verrucomicrobia bacterium ADurb.Bin122]